jgi:hypothetical protein
MKKVLFTVYLTIIAVLVIGEVKCIIKAFSCNWEPIGKAEIFYTGSAVCGLGCITGYFDIEDK